MGKDTTGRDTTGQGGIPPAVVTGVSIVALFGLWVLAATLTADRTILPQPWALIAPFWREVVSGELPYHLGATLLRVIWAFSLAMLAGVGWVPSSTQRSRAAISVG